MIPRELEASKRHYFGPDGIPIPLEPAQELTLGAVEFVRGLDFKPHLDFQRARRALGSGMARARSRSA
jgi:hypothetical protein